MPDSFPLAGRRSKSPSPRPRVLIAEDDDALRRLLELRLGLDGRFDVTSVADGRAALDAVRAQVPDLLVCDIMMPQVSGLAVCRDLRASGLSVPIILLSAHPRDESVAAVLALGNIEFMSKPYDALRLRESMCAMLEGASVSTV